MTESEQAKPAVVEREVVDWKSKSFHTSDNGMARGSAEACWARPLNSEATATQKLVSWRATDDSDLWLMFYQNTKR